MKRGERPPEGVKELVLQQAKRKRRPTNPQIAKTVKQRTGVDIHVRTIVRYCESAGLPTSSYRAPRQNQTDGANAGDVELGPHRRELFYTAQHLRNDLAVPLIELAIQTPKRDPEMAFWGGTAGYRPMAFGGTRTL